MCKESTKASLCYFNIFFYFSRGLTQYTTFHLYTYIQYLMVIIIRISKKNRQHNDQKKKVRKDKQRSTKYTHKTKDRVTRNQLKTGGFTVATMTWLIAMEYVCHKWPRICSTCRKHFPVISSYMTYHRVCN
jgi:hypothetical protein